MNNLEVAFIDKKMKIELLSNNIHLIPEIAELRFREFAHLVPGRTIGDFIKELENHLNDQLSIAYVVIDEAKEFIGTFSIRKYDMNTHQHLSPWVSKVLVHQDKRNQGIGSLIVKKAELTAVEMGYSCLYLFTQNKVAWYSKLGWEELEHTLFNTLPVTLMVKKLYQLDRDGFISKI